MAASKANVQYLCRSMKKAHWDSKAGECRPMGRFCCKRAPIPCIIGREHFHRVELLLQQQLARNPSMSVQSLVRALRGHGYVLVGDASVRLR